MKKLTNYISKLFSGKKSPVKTVALETELKAVHPRKSFTDTFLEANERFIEAIMASMNVPVRRDR